jgi:proteasome lid subunit RPN8/RPN11
MASAPFFRRRPLRIPAPLYADMIAHARAELPNECVGLLAGRPDGTVVQRYPLVNELADPCRFASEPYSMFRAEKQRRADGLEFLAVYHSHPSTPAVPSKYDLAQHYSEEAVCVIVSLAQPQAEVKGYWLRDGSYEPAEVIVGEGAEGRVAEAERSDAPV